MITIHQVWQQDKVITDSLEIGNIEKEGSPGVGRSQVKPSECGVEFVSRRLVHQEMSMKLGFWGNIKGQKNVKADAIRDNIVLVQLDLEADLGKWARNCSHVLNELKN